MDACDVKLTSQDFKAGQELVLLRAQETSFEEKVAQTLKIFRNAVGDEYYNAFEKQNEMDVQTAVVFGERLRECAQEIALAMENSSPIDSREVQAVIARQWDVLKMAYPDTASKRTYLAIRDQNYNSPINQPTPETAAFYEYMLQATEVFANTHFTQK